MSQKKKRIKEGVLCTCSSSCERSPPHRKRPKTFLEGQIHRTRPSRSTSVEKMKICTEYFHSGGATISTFIVDGVNAVSSFIMLSKIRGIMVVPTDNTTLTYNSLRMSTPHFMERSVVDSAGLFTGECAVLLHHVPVPSRWDHFKSGAQCVAPAAPLSCAWHLRAPGR